MEGPEFDPATIGDPIALKTEWTPLETSGSNFCTHKMVSISPTRVEFKSTLGLKLFSLLFIFVGCSVVGYFFYENYPFDFSEFTAKSYLTPLAGIVFAAAGFWFLHFSMLLIVFDRNENIFWKDRARARWVIYEFFNEGSQLNSCTLHDIHALQIISEFCRSSKNSYFSYELNIVMNDGRRINVVDHGNKEQLKRDANALSNFLNKPVWSAL